MGKAKKATKKFLKNSLDTEYERRNTAKPIKAKIAAKVKRENEKKKESKTYASTRAASTISKSSAIGEMDVDEFFAKGFQDILGGHESDEGEEDVGDGVENDAADDDSDDVEGEESGESDDDAGAVAGPAVGVEPAGAADVDEDSEEDDSGDDSDDDDGSGPAVPQEGKGKLKSEIAGHQASLEKLKREQPEFYAFMAENDPSLLSFAEGEASASDSDGDEEGEAGPAVEGEDALEEGDDAEEEVAVEKVGRAITMPMIRKWTHTLTGEDGSGSKSTQTLRAVILAFSAASYFGDTDDEGAPRRSQRYRIESGKIFNAVLSCALRHVPKYLNRVCDVKPAKPGRGAPLPNTSVGYKAIKGMIKLFLESTLHLVAKISSEDTDIFVLNAMVHMCPYFACFPKLNRASLKLMLHRWSHSAESVRVSAFLVIRMSAIVSPYPFIDIALKGIYLTFIRNCKFPSPVVRPTLTFMLNAVVELYRLDEVAAYQHAFVYIRQLAIHLRNAIVAKKKDGFLAVYNWQFLYALRVFAKLLAVVVGGEGGAKSGLKPLVYPLVQVTLGAIRLLPTPRYFAYRFHCVRSLSVLAEGTGIFIPLSNILLDVFDSAEMKKRPKPTTGKPMILRNILKVPKSQLNTPQFQDAAATEAASLALRVYSSRAYSVAFPESVFPDTVRIRRILKGCKSVSVSKRLKPVLEKLEENSAFVQRHRANVGFSPKDAIAVAAWEDELRTKGDSPLARYYRVMEAAEENRKKMQESTQHVEGDEYERKSKRSADNLDDDDDDEEEDEPAHKQKKGKRVEPEPAVVNDDGVLEDDEEDAEDSVRDFMLDDFAWDSD